MGILVWGVRGMGSEHVKKVKKHGGTRLAFDAW